MMSLVVCTLNDGGPGGASENGFGVDREFREPCATDYMNVFDYQAALVDSIVSAP